MATANPFGTNTAYTYDASETASRSRAAQLPLQSRYAVWRATS